MRIRISCYFEIFCCSFESSVVHEEWKNLIKLSLSWTHSFSLLGCYKCKLVNKQHLKWEERKLLRVFWRTKHKKMLMSYGNNLAKKQKKIDLFSS